MENLEQAGIVPDHGLEFPGFSTVFIQTFSIRYDKKFKIPAEYENLVLPEEYDDPALSRDRDFVFDENRKIYIEKADALGVPIVPMENNIENQIFVLPKEECGKKISDDHSVRRFSLRGFDFEMNLVPGKDDDFPPINMKCYVDVELSLFFGHTVSLTYRFLFNGAQGFLTGNYTVRKQINATTDHIIILLSTYLGAEYWSKEKESDDKPKEHKSKKSKTNINFETGFRITNFHYDEHGAPLESGKDLDLFGKGRTFDEIATRYKKFIYYHCTEQAHRVEKDEELLNKRKFKNRKIDAAPDNHFAMVDLWENVQHPDPVTNEDYFDKNNAAPLTEGQIISHIRNCHKQELIGLMTLYPGEWPYRDPEAYDEVCGENIAIDTDDLVLVNNNMCMVLGTYGRRGGDSDELKENEPRWEAKKTVNWAEHLKERAIYHVSWPEYLMILQMVLAKKHVIGKANTQLVEATLFSTKESSYELIGRNARLSMRLSKMVLLLDVVKYSKFTSHKVMFDRTTRRLNLDSDMERLSSMMEMVDNSLHNFSDYKSMKSDFMLNFILALISVASTFELFFQKSEMPFLSYFGYETNKFAAVLVAVVFGVTIFAFLLVITKTLGSVQRKIKSYFSL